MLKVPLLYLFIKEVTLITGKISPSLELWLHSTDINTLQKLQSFLGVGIINTRKYKIVTSFTVTKISDLVNIIIPHFCNFPLQTKKRVDFELWGQIVESKFK
jgi:hypothetical protein